MAEEVHQDSDDTAQIDAMDVMERRVRGREGAKEVYELQVLHDAAQHRAGTTDAWMHGKGFMLDPGTQARVKLDFLISYIFEHDEPGRLRFDTAFYDFYTKFARDMVAEKEAEIAEDQKLERQRALKENVGLIASQLPDLRGERSN